ncbi:fructosamine kinase [Auriculariales sp. MPI-PUGE-AT-0066]|nr:fructosamine kinase [Auriculariales sp. MPI-PUGE-AT-0066]
MPSLDAAVVAALPRDVENVSVTHHGGSGFASTFKITTDSRVFFMKTGRGDAARIMFAGEYESLNAIHAVDSSLCPAAVAHGALADTPNSFFLVTEFLHMGRGVTSSTVRSLAVKLANLHSTPAPSDGKFGFPVTTCCGSTPQPNEWAASWPEFYANNRLRFILQQCDADDELAVAVERTASEVVPRLLGRLNIRPVVVHGDLWSGNKGTAVFDRQDAEDVVENVVFDPAVCYGHSEYDLGIMKMFGGFSTAFFDEYHGLLPKQDPVKEYEDRVELYELYHHLNHYALFGGSYRGGAMQIMARLLRKYGDPSHV